MVFFLSLVIARGTKGCCGDLEFFADVPSFQCLGVLGDLAAFARYCIIIQNKNLVIAKTALSYYTAHGRLKNEKCLTITHSG